MCLIKNKERKKVQIEKSDDFFQFSTQKLVSYFCSEKMFECGRVAPPEWGVKHDVSEMTKYLWVIHRIVTTMVSRVSRVCVSTVPTSLATADRGGGFLSE